MPVIGYRVQRLGRYNRWENLGLYGERDGAEFYIKRIGQKGSPKAKFRIVEEEHYPIVMAVMK